MIWWFDEYEPDYVVGDLRIGETHHPFVFDCLKDELVLNVYKEPLKVQDTLVLFEKEKIIEKIHLASKERISEIHLGFHYCPGCHKLINIFEEQWSESLCLSCSLDYGSDLRDYPKTDKG